MSTNTTSVASPASIAKNNRTDCSGCQDGAVIPATCPKCGKPTSVVVVLGGGKLCHSSSSDHHQYKSKPLPVPGPMVPLKFKSHRAKSSASSSSRNKENKAASHKPAPKSMLNFRQSPGQEVGTEDAATDPEPAMPKVQPEVIEQKEVGLKDDSMEIELVAQKQENSDRGDKVPDNQSPPRVVNQNDKRIKKNTVIVGAESEAIKPYVAEATKKLMDARHKRIVNQAHAHIHGSREKCIERIKEPVEPKRIEEPIKPIRQQRARDRVVVKDDFKREPPRWTLRQATSIPHPEVSRGRPRQRHERRLRPLVSSPNIIAGRKKARAHETDPTLIVQENGCSSCSDSNECSSCQHSLTIIEDAKGGCDRCGRDHPKQFVSSTSDAIKGHKPFYCPPLPRKFSVDDAAYMNVKEMPRIPAPPRSPSPHRSPKQSSGKNFSPRVFWKRSRSGNFGLLTAVGIDGERYGLRIPITNRAMESRKDDDNDGDELRSTDPAVQPPISLCSTDFTLLPGRGGTYTYLYCALLPVAVFMAMVGASYVYYQTDLLFYDFLG